VTGKFTGDEMKTFADRIDAAVAESGPVKQLIELEDFGGIEMEVLWEKAKFAWNDAFWLRVAPDNDAALGCYESLGFVRAVASEQRRLNRSQPRDYVWLTRPHSD